MLRLNPTQLRLDARDLTWHVDRHNERQTLRTTGPPSYVASKSRISEERQHIRAHGSSHSVSQPPTAKTTEGIDDHEDSIISKEPVPQDSRSFWDRVLADAGTPTRTQTASMGNATVIEPTGEFLENNHSSRVSIEEDYTNLQDDNDDGPQHSDDLRSPFRDTEADISSPWPVPSSSGSSESTGVDPDIGANKTDEEKESPLTNVVKTEPAKRRLSFDKFNFFRRKVTPDLDGNLEVHDHRYLDNPDADHRYQFRPSHDRRRSDSSSSSVGGDLRDGMYGSRRDRRTISTNLEAYVNGRSDGEGGGSAHLSNETASRTSVRTVATPQHLEDIPRHASGLPRSSLYISHAAMSSSPHKGPDTPASYSEIPSCERLLAFRPRRRKRYKPRSESYPFASSEDLEAAALPQLDGPSSSQDNSVDLPSLTVSYPSTQNMVPTQTSGTLAWNYDFMGASLAGMPDHEDLTDRGLLGQTQTNYEWSSPHDSNQDSVEIHSYRSLSSMGSRHTRATSSHSQMGAVRPSPSHRNLSPYAEPYIPRSARRYASPQLPLPPPFSATPRSLSLNSVLPSSSISPHTPPSPLPSSPISPAFHSHAHIPIYNDNLSPSMQPQTPAELSRNRRPPMIAQNPFATAPARPQGMSTRDARLSHGEALGTPTRRPSARPRNHMSIDQENIGAVGAEERRWRREMAMGLRMGREEMERGRPL